MKKLLSGLLTIIMFVALIFTTALFITRQAFSGDSMGKMMFAVLEEENGNDADNLIEGIMGDEYNEDIEEYFNIKKLEKELGNFISDYFLYVSGVNKDKPELDELRDLVEDAVEKYEDEEGTKVDDEEIDIFFDELEAELDANELLDDEVTDVMAIIFSGGLLYGSMAVVVLCLALIYVLNKDIKKTVKRAGILFIIDGILVFGLGALLNALSNAQADLKSILGIVVNLFNTGAIICIVIGIVLIVVSKVLKKNTNIASSNEAIQNLDDSVIK